jgi:hypothetical protein
MKHSDLERMEQRMKRNQRGGGQGIANSGATTHDPRPTANCTFENMEAVSQSLNLYSSHSERERPTSARAALLC